MLKFICISEEILYSPSPRKKTCSWTQVYLFLISVEMFFGEGPRGLVPGDHDLLKHLIPYTSCKTSMAEIAGKTSSSLIIITHFQLSSFPTEVTNLIPRNVPYQATSTSLSTISCKTQKSSAHSVIHCFAIYWD